MKQIRSSRGVIRIAALLSVISVSTAVWAEPTTQPAIADSLTTRPTVASVLVEMDTAYGKLQTAQFDGHIIGRFDVQGNIKNEDVPFTSSYAAPNQFRHEVAHNIVIGSTGSAVYSYLAPRDEYQSTDAPQTRVASTDWPASVAGILAEQNPSLLLAISKSAGDELTQLSKAVTLENPTAIDGISYQTLRFTIPADHRVVTMLVDPATHLLRQVKSDMKQSLEKAGTADVKVAEVTVDYTKSIPDAALANNVFAWTVPAGAILATTTGTVAGADDGMTDDLKALIGKDAPDFSLTGLDDKTVKLSDLKGSVVIVDFWATWCGPCVASLPHLDQLYKAQSANGLKVLAVNLKEDKSTVKSFVEKKGWSLPVVLDTDGNVAGIYKAEAIPETVVVGKDGKVKQIFIGGGHEEDISNLISKELK